MYNTKTPGLKSVTGPAAALFAGASALALGLSGAFAQSIDGNPLASTDPFVDGGFRQSIDGGQASGDPFLVDRAGSAASAGAVVSADGGNAPDDDASLADDPDAGPLVLSVPDQVRAGRATSVGPIANPDDPDGATRSNLPASRVQSNDPAADPADAFGNTGFRVGTFNGSATLEQAIGYSSNLSGRVDGEAGAFSQTDGFLSLTSDWSRHQWQTVVSGSYRRPFDSDEIDREQLFAQSSLRLDLVDGYTLTASGFYNLQSQSFTDSTLAPGAIDTPRQRAWGGSLELQRTGRKLQLTLRGSIDRNVFEDADLGGGVTVSQEDRNNNLYRVTGRIGYEISPAVVPFVEASYGVREFDLSTDRNGNRRDSEIEELRGGLQLDFGDKLRGEIAVGYVRERFDDPLLDDLTGYTVNGQLEWSPERDSQFLLTLGTQTNDSIAANESGSVIYAGRIDYSRQSTARLSWNAFADIQYEDSDTSDTTLAFGGGLQYWINRFTAMTADVEYRSFTSDAPNSGFDETSGRLGVLWSR